jgi:hypothetical protein
VHKTTISFAQDGRSPGRVCCLVPASYSAEVLSNLQRHLSCLVCSLAIVTLYILVSDLHVGSEEANCEITELFSGKYIKK